MADTATRILLVGAHGFGAVHLRRLEELGDRVELVGLVDPKAPPAEGFGSTAPCWPSLAEALAANAAAGTNPDIVIVATPTGTHAAIASVALNAGCDVYLEKPPVATMADFEALLALQESTGRAVQVGFQSLASDALKAIAELGTPTSVAAWGSWVRTSAYWNRSRWAGKRMLDGAPIVDGVVTNPLAHAVATALRIAGARRREDVARVELELLRANNIEADDTSAVRVTLTDGRVVSAALTLCASEQTAPLIEVRTPSADAVLSYKDDTVTVKGVARTYDAGDLLVELIEHRQTGAALSSSLADCGAFMQVLEAVRTAPDPVAISPEFITIEGAGADAHPVVDNVEWWVERTARSGALFSDLRVPWGAAPAPGVVDELLASDVPIGARDDGSTVARTSSPRPFLHPLRTAAGVAVTDAHPLDHDWHLGISFGIQHAEGTNFWGGRTYTSDQGYRWLDDEGAIRTVSFERTLDGFAAEAQWVATAGSVLLNERTEFAAVLLDEGVWTFTWQIDLTAPGADAVRLGSPGSHGRTGGGYGGFAWRLPAGREVDVRTPLASGEALVHGTVAPWIAWSASFAEGPATVVVAAADEVTSADPWFVRVDSYPGIGSALAWDQEVVVLPGSPLRRRFRAVVADGILSDAEVAALVARSGVVLP